MNKYFTLITFILSLNSIGQNSKIFVIKEYIKNDGLTYRNKNDFKFNQENIYEDELYIVSKTCSGEWGGTVKFKNKKTNIEYSASATCPVAVNKLNGKYYVTNSLAHLDGFSEILEIKNPALLTVIKKTKRRKKKSKIIISYESQSNKGTKQLLDSVGALTLASFPFKGQLYHIVTDYNNTFLAKIDNNKFVKIDTISDESIWSDNLEAFITIDKHLIIFFENRDVKGYFDIIDNHINIIRQR
ncbi:hypothetical protein [Flavobacterium sp. PS2]|uniref:hypothetical protein n=1 Tax=Flavobacterium sp. PS2 TaxID=3384157 RepID=UPI00390C9963